MDKIEWLVSVKNANNIAGEISRLVSSAAGSSIFENNDACQQQILKDLKILKLPFESQINMVNNQIFVVSSHWFNLLPGFYYG